MKHVSEIVSTLGVAQSRTGNFPFGIHLADRLMHLHVVGQTGTGKSTLLANLALQDAARGFGFCLIYPHGDLADELAAQLGARAHIWAPAEPGNTYGYNPLTRVPEAFHPLVAAGLIDAFKKQWADAWEVRMEHLLRHALLTLLVQPQADLRDVVPLFIDTSVRSRMLSRVTDPQVRGFWLNEFPKMNYKTAFDGVAPTANKLGAFLTHPNVRRALCEPQTPLRFRKIMDEGQWLIVNLSKGRLGADVTNLLGGLIVASIVNAALSRQTLPAPQRRPFLLHVDELHAFTTASIANILPETRKYGLGLTLVHQHIAQVDTAVFDAILGNVGSLMVFRVGANDAPVFVRQLERFTRSDLINQPNHRAYMRVMVNGHKSSPWRLCPPRKKPPPHEGDGPAQYSLASMRVSTRRLPAMVGGYTREATTLKRNAADFLFPGEDEYADRQYPDDQLAMLAEKTSCKDRWRQVLTEAVRIRTKHLLTLEPAISKIPKGEMQGQGLQLVLPPPCTAHIGLTSALGSWESGIFLGLSAIFVGDNVI